MASIRSRKKQNGDTTHLAEIVIKRNGQILHRDSRSFPKKSQAEAWGKKREQELRDEETPSPSKPEKLIISDLIDEYLTRYSSGRTKESDLKKLKNSKLAKKNIYHLTSKDIMAHCELRSEKAKPQTINNDLIWLKSTLSTIKARNNYKYSLDMIDDARIILKREKKISKSGTRSRRPTNKELWLISRKYYPKRKKTTESEPKLKPKKLHYLHILWFSIYSTRRISEVCKLQWGDLKEKEGIILVRDMKDPNGEKIDRWAKLPRSALKIILKQPKGKGNDKIFPYNPRTISDKFTKTCKLLGIMDLHLHDMRHEGISRLFEKRLTIPEVCLVSLHQSWSSLKKYTNLKPEDLDI